MQKTRTRLWSVLLTVAMLLTLLPATALAADEPFVEMTIEGISEQYSDQEDFFSALQAAEGKIDVKLLTDVEVAGVIPVEEDQIVTLDLNGCRLSTTTQPTDNTRHYYAINNYGIFTLIDTAGDGEIYARGIQNLGDGKMYVEGGTIISCDENGGAAIWNEAELVVSGGTFKTEFVGSPNDSVGIGCLNNSGTALVTGGTFYDVNRRTYAIISTGELEITPAEEGAVTVYGAHGALAVDSGVAVVNGGDYSSSDYYGLYVSNDGKGTDPEQAAVTVNGGTFTGKSYAVWIGSDYNDPVNSTIEINGGVFNNPLNAQECTREGAIVVRGGIFSSDDVSEFVPKSSEMVENSGGTITVVPLTAADAVAKVIRNGRTDYYKTLSDAVAEAQAGDTVTLLKDASGDGVVVPSDSDIIFDFAGHTYNIDGTTVGSAGTETNGFQLLRDSNVEFRNGTLMSAKAAILIQNYSNLTLRDMVLISEKSKAYALSNNFGEINIVGSTSITAASDGVAFDVYYWPDGGYSNGVSVTLDTTGTITGKIEYGSDDTEVGKANIADKAKLYIKNGAVDGWINTYGLSETGNTGIAVSGGTFTSSVKEYVVEGLGYELNNQGEYSYYETLDEALSYAKPGAKITDLTDEGGGEALNVAIVTFDPNNGSRDWSVPVVVGDSVARPADPERAGYRFVGWYLNGYFYDFGAPVTADLTLTALWREIGGSSGSTEPTYVAALEKMTNGSAVVSPKQAQEGDEVTITVTPDAGYVVDEVIVTDAHGDDVRVYEEGNNVYTFTMPDSRVTIEVTFKAKETAPAVPTAPAGWVNPFADVAANAWYYDAVGYANANGLMGGTSATTFAPNGAMNRSMVWTVIARLAGQTISGTNWAEDAKAWAVAQGVSDGTNPDGNVTREELVTMLYRYIGSPVMNVPELGLISSYPDAASVSDWAQNALAWALSTGVIDGRDGKLASGESVTRAEAATILARFHLLTK